MIISGECFSETVGDPNIQSSIRGMVADHVARHPHIAELAEYIATAAITFITADEERVLARAVRDRQVSRRQLRGSHADLMMVEMERHPDNPSMMHVYMLSKYYQASIIDWTLHYDVGDVGGGAPLLSLEFNGNTNPSVVELGGMKHALGPAEVGRHFTTLRLISEVMREPADAS